MQVERRVEEQVRTAAAATFVPTHVIDACVLALIILGFQARPYVEPVMPHVRKVRPFIPPVLVATICILLPPALICFGVLALITAPIWLFVS
jgi:hypothetical protein